VKYSLRLRPTDRVLGSGVLPATTDLSSTRPTRVASMTTLLEIARIPAAGTSRAELIQTSGRLCGQIGIAVRTVKSEPRTE
jgi:hypothetical protein